MLLGFDRAHLKVETFMHFTRVGIWKKEKSCFKNSSFKDLNEVINKPDSVSAQRQSGNHVS